jgi:hypothetical protein
LQGEVCSKDIAAGGVVATHGVNDEVVHGGVWIGGRAQTSVLRTWRPR